MAIKFGHQDGPGKLAHASGIAISQNGDVAVPNKMSSQVIMYSIDGKYKFSIDITNGQTLRQKLYPHQITVNSDGSCRLVTDMTDNVKPYDVNCKFKGPMGILTAEGILPNTMPMWPGYRL